MTARRQPNGFIVYSVDTDAVWPVQQWYTGRCYIYDDSIIEGDDEGESLIQTIRKAIVQYGCRVLLLDNLMTAMQDDTANDFTDNSPYLSGNSQRWHGNTTSASSLLHIRGNQI